MDSPNAPKLKKQLGLLAIFSIAAGAMISSGLFVLPGLAYAQAGPAVILSYALAALLMIPVVLAKAELATAMPKSGGSYFFIERSLGPLVGTVAGLANWLSISLKSAFALVGIGALATLLFPGMGIWGIKGIALLACLTFTVLNVVSIKETGKLQVALVLGLLMILLLYILCGSQKVDLDLLHSADQSFIRHGWQAVFAVAGMVFISFGGLTKVVSVSEEIKDPLVVLVTVGVVDPDKLAGSLVPLSLGAEATMGRWGAVLVDLGALFAFATTANAGLLAASRTPLAMSRDGLVPEFLSKTNKRFESPHLAILLTAGFIIVVILFLSVEDLVKTASTMMILMFTLQSLSVIIMRYSGLQNYRPTFKAPFVPGLQIVAIVVFLFLIFEMGTVPLLLTGLFVVLATISYLVYVRPRIDRESAFVFMVKRIISKNIVTRGLEDELKHITLERDEIALDRFDQLVAHSVILDLPRGLPAKELFHEISRALSPRLGMTEEQLFELFLQRERESSTVIRPGLAIPHIIVDGEHVFELLLVRCREGVVFSELHPPVRTAFVLVGSPDERNYHLRALMNIAHIVMKPSFEQQWFQARGAEELRDVLLLSGRPREG